jgi:hypothetical protein
MATDARKRAARGAEAATERIRELNENPINSADRHPDRRDETVDPG